MVCINRMFAVRLIIFFFLATFTAHAQPTTLFTSKFKDLLSYCLDENPFNYSMGYCHGTLGSAHDLINHLQKHKIKFNICFDDVTNNSLVGALKTAVKKDPRILEMNVETGIIRAFQVYFSCNSEEKRNISEEREQGLLNKFIKFCADHHKIKDVEMKKKLCSCQYSYIKKWHNNTKIREAELEVLMMLNDEIDDLRKSTLLMGMDRTYVDSFKSCSK